MLVLVLSAFVLGPLYTELALRDYFSDSRTYTYITRNLGLVNMQWDLPGVFARSAFPHAINGSLTNPRLRVM